MSKKSPKGKPKRNEEKWPKVFRCNFQSIIILIDSFRAKMPLTHIEAMMRTSFGRTFKPLHDEKVNVGTVGMKTRYVEKIISTFSNKECTFNIGGKMLKITLDDIAVTFGLTKHGKMIVVQPRAKMEKIEYEFKERQFNGKSKLNKAAITRTINENGP